MQDPSPFEQDVFLKGSLLVIVRARRDARPIPGKRILVEACGFV